MNYSDKQNDLTFNRQKGAVFITALMFLGAVTMLVLSSTQNVGLTAQIAANQQEVNRLFQATESCISRTAEDRSLFNRADRAVGEITDTINDFVDGANVDVAMERFEIPPFGNDEEDFRGVMLQLDCTAISTDYAQNSHQIVSTKTRILPR